MKQLFRSFTRFSPREKAGITGLVCLLLLLLATRCLLSYRTQPYTDAAWQAKQENAWAAFCEKHKTATREWIQDTDNTATATLFRFDPNTLDSSGFRQLGLTARTTHLLLNWRRKGKHFYHKEELRSLYTLTPEAYIKLEPYITIASAAPPWQRSFSNGYQPLPASIDLNRTDSATLVRLRGIGPVLAHRIIERRQALGGFLRHEQLLEVYRFNDTVFTMLKEKLVIDVTAVKKLSLNNADFEQLKAHPYIGEKMARNILLFREGLQRFTNIEQLRQVPLMNEEIYRKIAPYFVIE